MASSVAAPPRVSAAGGGHKPLEQLLPLDKRDEIRRQALARTPRFYNPYLHLAVPSLFALTIIGVCIALLRDFHPLQLLTIPVVYLFSNADEWRIHRDLLHKRSLIAPVLYDRHTPEHHMIYVTDDMAMRDRREFRLVLIPAYGLFLIFIGVLPIAALIWYAGYRNIALLFTATSMFYSASYEWLHLSYHLPASSRIGGSRLIHSLKRHHAIHHDPRLMQRWNFNVTVPLWDWVMRTTVKDRDRLVARETAAAAQSAP